MGYVPRAEQEAYRAEMAAMARRHIAAAERQEAELAHQDAAREQARVWLAATLQAARECDPAVLAGARSGLSLREIARISGLSRTTVTTILARSKCADNR
jgi:hypothetical protein